VFFEFNLFQPLVASLAELEADDVFEINEKTPSSAQEYFLVIEGRGCMKRHRRRYFDKSFSPSAT
jgi:hypothetical protein